MSLRIHTVRQSKQQGDGEKAYSVRERTRAFLQRPSGFGPLVEVAREGLTGGYKLSLFLENRYAGRISNTHSATQMCDLLMKGVPDQAQAVFAMQLKADFEDGLKALASLKRMLGEDNPVYGAWQEEGATLAKYLTGLRGKVAETLAGGFVTSEDSQLTLASIFQHYRVLDGSFEEPARELSGHLKAILESEGVGQKLKGELIDSVVVSGCKDCKQAIGLPGEPEDRRYPASR
jgi:hypothetical protein